MRHNDVVITHADAYRLRRCMQLSGGLVDANQVQVIEQRIRRAHMVRAGAVPSDLVTMHSTVRVTDLSQGRHDVYTLVYPVESDLAAGLLSAITPLGAALLGSRVGDLLQVPGAAGAIAVRISQMLYQPEAEGDEPAAPCDAIEEKVPAAVRITKRCL